VARILRGDVRWADLNPVRGQEQAGLRPVLVLSQDVFNERSGTVIAVALTSQEPRAGFPLTLESRAAGLRRRSWIKIGQVRTLSVERLGKRFARASEEELAQVVDGLNEIVGG
jgi:mRNA interferase MazF